MKNVILYIRVSTDEQADKGFSLRDQEQKLLNYCKINSLNVMAVFKEDYSAKTFNRPEFKKLMSFCKSQSKHINQLLFIKWDRFSRNTAESYNVIKTFTNLGIVVNAIEQPLDLNIPEQGLMLAVYLSMPEVENHRRSLNVIAGMRRAFKEGRYVASPPKGYDMGRDNTNKPILVPNADAKLICEGFEMLAKGIYNQKEVFSILKNKGLDTSKSAYNRIIRNPIYKGEIYIKAFKDEKEMTVQGIHEPIVSKTLFDDVQQIINGRKKQFQTPHKKVNDKFPLKGFILCPKCQNPLMASTSKGRSNYYSYYHCSSPCNTRYKVDEVELWFNKFLTGIQLKPNIQSLLFELIKNRFNSQIQNKRIGPQHYKKVNEIKEKQIRLQDLYIDGKLDSNDFQEAKLRYENILSELKSKEAESKKPSEVLKVFKSGLKKLECIENLYQDAHIYRKRELIGSIFPEKFQFEKNQVRTKDINPILIKISSINQSFDGNKKRDKSKKDDLSQLVLKAGLEPARPNGHRILSPACLPIPPLERTSTVLSTSIGILIF